MKMLELKNTKSEKKISLDEKLERVCELKDRSM